MEKLETSLKIFDSSIRFDLQLSVKHVCDQSILSAKISPLKNTQLISCGKENIRFWRSSKSHLSGLPVTLNHYARNSTFTVFDFVYPEVAHFSPSIEKNSDEVRTLWSSPSHLLVGAKSGMIFQINFVTHELETVYKLHDSAICSISVRNSFCVTGSEDQYVRLWPLNFSEFLLECKQDSSVISLEINQTCSNVIVGCFEGSLSLLDLQKQTCRTFLSPVDQEISCIVKVGVQRILTLGSKNVISVWDGLPLNQSYEFECGQNDECLTLSCIDDNRFLGGFQSGVLRVFDINKLSVVTEKLLHKNPIVHISATKNSEFAICGDQSGVYSLVSLSTNLNLICYFESTSKIHAIESLQKSVSELKVSSSFNKSETVISLISRDNKTINFYDIKSHCILNSIWLGNNQPHTVLFSTTAANHLFVLSCDKSIKIYDLADLNNPILLFDLTNSHDYFVSCVVPIFEDKVFVSSGGDGKLKVWGLFDNGQFGCTEYDFHSNGIYALTFDETSNTLYSAGGFEGIFVWDFQFDVHVFINECKKVNESKQLQVK